MTTESPISDNINEKTIGWLDKNKDAFGHKILCAGVDMSVAEHIAHLFPDSNIVFLTKEDPDKVDNGLEQPLVIQSGLDDYDGGMFDTLIVCASVPLCPPNHGKDSTASRIYHWLHGDQPYPDFEHGTLYLRRATLLMEYYENAATILRRNLREGGTLLNLVRSEQDEHLLGYCLSLAAEVMQVRPAVRQILCRENGKRVTLQAIRAVAGGRTDVNSLIAENLNFNLDKMDTSAVELEGKKAEILLQADLSQLVRGYNIYQEDNLMGKLAIYTSAQREGVIYYFTDIQGDVPYLRRFHVNDQDKILRHMVGELHRQKAADSNVRWHELYLNDDWSETEATVTID